MLKRIQMIKIMQKRNTSRQAWTMESLAKSRQKPTSRKREKSSMSIADFKVKSQATESESKIQKDLMKALQAIPYKGMRLSDFVYAVPNGGYRHKTTAKNLQGEGVKKGVPDLHCFIAVHPYHSLYIEMKTEKGDLTDSQENLIPLLRQEGHKVVVCRSVKSALDEIFKYLGIEL